ncbi:MAG: Hpt domain-containing protein [Dehalococcoidia bacterium]|nr:Hpt domain-containing protein [Dehalococcoidia bacterium]
MDVLIDRFDGDAEMLGQVGEAFLQAYPSQLSAVRDAVERRDAGAVARTSHILKGSVGIFGTDGAYETARRLESFGRATDLSRAEQAYADLERQVTELGQLLAKLPS